jgi:hypothetical protein
MYLQMPLALMLLIVFGNAKSQEPDFNSCCEINKNIEAYNSNESFFDSSLIRCCDEVASFDRFRTTKFQKNVANDHCFPNNRASKSELYNLCCRLCDVEEKPIPEHYPYFCMLKKEHVLKLKVGIIVTIVMSILLIGIIIGLLLYIYLGMHDYEEIFDHGEDQLSECKVILSTVNMMRESKLVYSFFDKVDEEKSVFFRDFKNYFTGPYKLLEKDLNEGSAELKVYGSSDMTQLTNDENLFSRLPCNVFTKIMTYTLESDLVRGVQIEKICSYATKYLHFEEYDDVSIFFNYFNIDFSLIRQKNRFHFFKDNKKMFFNILEAEIENL